MCNRAIYLTQQSSTDGGRGPRSKGCWLDSDRLLDQPREDLSARSRLGPMELEDQLGEIVVQRLV